MSEPKCDAITEQATLPKRNKFINPPFVSNYHLRAKEILEINWSCTMEKLKEAEKKNDFVWFYVDSRARPDQFYILLALAYPDLYFKIKKRPVCKSVIRSAINLIFVSFAD